MTIGRYTLPGCTVTVDFHGRAASDLDKAADAERAAEAVGQWLLARGYGWASASDGALAQMREEYATLANGDAEGDEEATPYWKLLREAEKVAYGVAVMGWDKAGEAYCEVDIEP